MGESLMGFEGSERNGFCFLVVKSAGVEIKQLSAIDNGLRRAVAGEIEREWEKIRSCGKEVGRGCSGDNVTFSLVMSKVRPRISRWR
jgi:hypothetical protein